MEEGQELVGQALDLVESISALKSHEREYIFLRIVGVGEEKAEEIVNKRWGMKERWGSKEDKNFKITEAFILARRELYIKPAMVIFLGEMQGMAIFVLKGILEKAMEWESLERDDKSFTMQAIRVLLPMMGVQGVTDKTESYEEVVHRIRKGRN